MGRCCFCDAEADPTWPGAPMCTSCVAWIEQKAREAKPEPVVVELGPMEFFRLSPRQEAIEEFRSIAGLRPPARGDLVH